MTDMTDTPTPTAGAKLPCHLRTTDTAPGFAQADLSVPDPDPTPGELQLHTLPEASHPLVVGGQPKGMWCSGCRLWVYRDATGVWPNECPGCGARGRAPAREAKP